MSNVLTMKSNVWRVHTLNLLTEMVENNNKMGIFFQPVNIFREILCQVAERAIELNDPQLNILMLRLALYEVAPDNITEVIEQQEKLITQK